MNTAQISLLNLAFLGMDLPSFDWKAAAIVAAVAAVATVAIVGLAIAMPAVGIVAGAGILKTALEIGAIALLVSTVAGTAAGLYWGHKGDLALKQRVNEIRDLSMRADVYFSPSESDPKNSKPHSCTLVFYNPTGLGTSAPSIDINQVAITASGSRDFENQIRYQLGGWAKAPTHEGDGTKRISIYMEPFPGENVYSMIRQIVQSESGDACRVDQVEGPWKSAWEDKK